MSHTGILDGRLDKSNSFKLNTRKLSLSLRTPPLGMAVFLRQMGHENSR
jgi:hypothetical protein